MCAQNSIRVKLAAALAVVFIVGGTLAARAACSYDLTPAARSHGYGAATAAVAVATSSGCAWTVVNNNSWIDILSGSSGSGNGTVTYALSGNPNPGTRTGVIRIGGKDFTITQTGVTCTYSISPPEHNKCPSYTTGSVQISTQSPCPWTIANPNDWIIITSATSGTGSSKVFFTVLANASTMSRTGVVMMAGLPFTIRQTSAGGITCPADKQVDCGTAWTFDQPTVTGGGVVVQVVSTVTNPVCGNSFIAIRTWSATDACGTQMQCSQSVAVLDLTPPVAICPPDKSVGCGQPWNFNPPTGNDACDNAPALISIVSTVTNAGPAANFSATRTYRVADRCGNAVTCSQTVTFTNSSFTVVCPPNRLVPCDGIWNFDLPTISGGCGAVITIVSTVTNSGTCGANYIATRVWTITDGVTTSNCTQTVEVVDQTPPTITCPPDITVSNTNDVPHCPKTLTEFILGGGAASDNCGPVRYVCTDGPLQGGPCGGIILRTHIAYDACMNTNTCVQRIIVVGSSTVVSISVQTSGAETNPCLGGTLTFCANVAGIGPFSYTWLLDGSAIPGATASCLTITNLIPANVGRYSVQVVGMCETVTQPLSIPNCGAQFAPAIGGLQFVPAGVYLKIIGQPHRTYLVLCGTDVSRPWNVIGAATTAANGIAEFIDQVSGNEQSRMYRLRIPAAE